MLYKNGSKKKAKLPRKAGVEALNEYLDALQRELGGMKVAISDNAQGRNSRTIHTLAIAARESHKPVPFSYCAISRTPVKLPQQKYSGHQTPKMSSYVAFRPFGIHF